MAVPNYKLSSEAEKDLEGIWNYTFETWSIEQADRYLYQIFEEIEYIAAKPQTGKDLGFLKEGYLRTKVKLHFIFYRVDKKSDIVEIIRVLHQRMDVENHLK